MNPEIQRSRINSSKSRRRLQKRKRAHSVHRYDYRERKMLSMLAVMELFLLGRDSASSMLDDLIQAQGKGSLPPEIRVQPPTDVNYSVGILNLGHNNFLSAAVTFCHDVAREGRMTIVSVGCGDGSIEKKIVETYRERYGKHSSGPNIILVDPDRQYKVHFKYVDELVEKRPDIVGHCALFIFWPEPQPRNKGYDIEAIRTLQPHGVLTVYGSGGGSGSQEYVNFLCGGNELLQTPLSELGLWNHQNIAFDITEECESHGLDNYEIDEVAVYKEYRGKLMGTSAHRMAVVRRIDFQFVNVCPAINWSCKREEMEFKKFVSKRLGEESLSPWSLSRIAYPHRISFNMESLGLVW